ncbi:MAG: zinc/iron-chelating domain-containing protein [Betaproteobacteria bacterium HGW-Betaproteobacteria-22]|nr:MAG: zinc/iron-chelating domain-containing protein [Betaproteobacteria bacterium HGW-Betaproteobacteria-22]
MQCRENCGACCIAPSITSPIPGMPNGKKAGERCIQLNAHHQCKIFSKAERPAFCASLQPSLEMCGDMTLGQSREYAIAWLTNLEQLTQPN